MIGVLLDVMKKVIILKNECKRKEDCTYYCFGAFSQVCMFCTNLIVDKKDYFEQKFVIGKR